MLTYLFKNSRKISVDITVIFIGVGANNLGPIAFCQNVLSFPKKRFSKYFAV